MPSTQNATLFSLGNTTPPIKHGSVEIVDEHDNPLCVIALPDASQQTLRHRAVLVLVYDERGRLYLQKRSRKKTLYPGRWDLSATGHVEVGEAREDAAIRELYEELGVRVTGLRFVHDVPASHSTGYAFVSLYSAGRVTARLKTNPEEVSGGMYVDEEELALLVRDFRDQLTPAIVTFWELGMLF